MPQEIENLHKLLSEIELTLRERLKEIGVDLPHLLVVTGPSGDTLILGQMDSEMLKRVCADLGESADQELRRRSVEDSLPPQRCTDLNHTLSVDGGDPLDDRD
jgi:hypothetical protein